MNERDITALWNFDDPAESERRFREALASDTGALSSSAEILTQIARAQGLQLQFSNAHAVLDEVESLEELEHVRVRIRVELERGRLFNSAGEPVKAVPFFTRAYELAAQSNEVSLAIDAVHMLAIASPPEEQLGWNERALEMAETVLDPDAQGWVGSLLNNVGWTYHDRDEFEFALDRFRRAVEWRRKRGQPKETRIAEWCVGRTLRSLGRFEDALVIQTGLAAEWEAVGGSDPYVDEELAECLHASGRAEEARSHFTKASEGLAADPWFVKNEPGRLERLKRLGQPDSA